MDPTDAMGTGGSRGITVSREASSRNRHLALVMSQAAGPHVRDSAEREDARSVSDFDSMEDFDPAELQEFLAVDQYPVPADPAFKERLRAHLWRFIKQRDSRNPR